MDEGVLRDEGFSQDGKKTMLDFELVVLKNYELRRLAPGDTRPSLQLLVPVEGDQPKVAISRTFMARRY